MFFTHVHFTWDIVSKIYEVKIFLVKVQEIAKILLLHARGVESILVDEFSFAFVKYY